MNTEAEYQFEKEIRLKKNIKVKIVKVCILENQSSILIGYHGTSRENAENILKKGFEIELSDEMFFGKGLYLSRNIEDARFYKERWEKGGKDAVVLEVKLPQNVEWCYVEQWAGIGTLEQYIEDKKDINWLEEQINERIIENNLFNFPRIILTIEKDDLILIKNNFPQIYNDFQKYYEKEEKIIITKRILNKLNKEERKQLIRYFEYYFELDEDSVDEWVRKDYYSLAEGYGECDVEIAPTQIIIHDEKILKELQIKIIEE